MAEITDDQLADLGTAPLKARTDEGTVEERPVDDIIRARRELQQGNVDGTPWGIKFARVKPGGTV